MLLVDVLLGGRILLGIGVDQLLDLLLERRARQRMTWAAAVELRWCSLMRRGVLSVGVWG